MCNRSPSPDQHVILVVDDDEIAQDLISQTLENHGYHVLTARHGVEALAFFDHERPNLVLLDAEMPVMDGFTTCEKIKKHHDATVRRIPVMIVTALGDDASINRAFAAGAEEYINKPIKWVVLQHRIQVILHQQKLEIERHSMMLSMREALEAAQLANQAKSRFLAAMSHDIRTPMNAILGMGELLQESILTEEQKNYVQVFQDAGTTLLALINDILDLSKIEAGQLEMDRAPFDLSLLLHGTINLLRNQAEKKGLILKIALPDNLPIYVLGDRERLRQVLLNLLNNAVKFSSEGAVTLAVEHHRQDYIQFSVKDTGIGISKERQAKIFEPFAQEDQSISRRFGGTGLGLSICRHLVRKMRGSIWVKSTPERGSVFYFTAYLPDVEQDSIVLSAMLSQKQFSSNHSEQNQDLRILLVDDAEDNRMLISAYLKKTPYHLTIAVNGQEGVEQFQSGSFDLVLMDVQMPVMDGFEATRRIRAWEDEHQYHPVPIIALTAHAMREVSEQVREAGCSLHLTKPIQKAHLLSVIGQMTERSRCERSG
ncbi:response regulator [Magnetococcales bacterium HHB-1]